MTSWRGALVLFQHEMRRSWVGLIVSILLFLYVSLFTFPLLPVYEEPNPAFSFDAWLGDFFYLSLIPCLGFLMGQHSFKFWKRDYLKEKIAYWRTMPIQMSSIVIFRIIQMLVVFLIVGLVFFASQYLVSGGLRQALSLSEYLGFLLIWLGYGLVVASTYIYFEMAIGGRIYLIVCFLYIFIYAFAVLLLWLNHFSVLEYTLNAARQHKLLLTICMPVAGILSILVIGWLVKKRLDVSNLAQ
ncbi:hypothetical protein ACFOLF_23845 [Paenibacillus sepulcri]|uniref:ABC transporter permease n=1 Tax=Paenibacillus sepulcri TaxID=359917 RepID=A0ABS7BWC2_9BACL|nr:hypothetical protein [Paenibacillus sepulcri]